MSKLYEALSLRAFEAFAVVQNTAATEKTTMLMFILTIHVSLKKNVFFVLVVI